MQRPLPRTSPGSRADSGLATACRQAHVSRERRQPGGPIHTRPVAEGGWTHHPDLEVPDAGERLLDPAWVSAAITTAGLTRDW